MTLATEGTQEFPDRLSQHSVEREDRQPWSGPDADYLRLMNDSDTVERLIKEYGGCQELNDVMEGITFELDKATKAKAKRDYEQWKDILNGNYENQAIQETIQARPEEGNDEPVRMVEARGKEVCR